MKTFSALLALCEGNPPVTGGFSSQRPVTRGFDVFFDLRLHKRLSKQSRRGYLRRHRTHYDVTVFFCHGFIDSESRQPKRTLCEGHPVEPVTLPSGRDLCCVRSTAPGHQNSRYPANSGHSIAHM